jgi:hypothetical protein
MSDGLPVQVLQFGTSRFLQAHADLFFSVAEPALGVAVVQTTDDPTRARRLQALTAPEGYPVRIRGLVGGRPVDEERRIRSVRRCLQTAQDWAAIERRAVTGSLDRRGLRQLTGNPVRFRTFAVGSLREEREARWKAPGAPLVRTSGIQQTLRKRSTQTSSTSPGSRFHQFPAEKISTSRKPS